jgi:hypothetical protein
MYSSFLIGIHLKLWTRNPIEYAEASITELVVPGFHQLEVLILQQQLRPRDEK